MPDKTQGRPLPESQKAAPKSRNRPTEFDADALIFQLTGVRVTEVDGLGASTVLTVLSETGPDLAARFPTDKHFAAWTTLAPQAPIGQADPLSRPDGQPGGQGVSAGGAVLAQK